MALPGEFPKRCAVCRRIHTADDWAKLRYVGPQGTTTEGFVLELRDCHCGSTLAVVVLDDEREAA